MKCPVTIGDIQNGIENIANIDKYSLSDVLPYLLKQGIVATQITEATFEQLLCCEKQYPEPILIIGEGTTHSKEALLRGTSKSETYPVMMLLINTEPHIVFPFSQEDNAIWLGTQIRQQKFEHYNGKFEKYCKTILNSKISPMHSVPQGSERKLKLLYSFKCTLTYNRTLVNSAIKKYA